MKLYANEKTDHKIILSPIEIKAIKDHYGEGDRDVIVAIQEALSNVLCIWRTSWGVECGFPNVDYHETGGWGDVPETHIVYFSMSKGGKPTDAVNAIKSMLKPIMFI